MKIVLFAQNTPIFYTGDMDMEKKVTVLDIANALNLSRNTVSKALNGKNVPTKTRNMVINTAIEMGYKGYQLAASSEASLGQKKVVILSSRLLMNINYYISVLRGIEETLTNYDIELIQFSITNPDSFSKFKRYLSNNQVDGIICIEFFDPGYIVDLLELDSAVIFLDYPIYNLTLSGKYDIILPESFHEIKNFCIRLINEEDCRTFGFVGDYFHCLSFYERFNGMREALFLSGLPVDLHYSILNDDSTPYDPSTLVTALKNLPALPDCFVAANDTIAINLLAALQQLKVPVPSKVKVIGFDNIAEAKRTNPPLTSINVNKAALGKKIITQLLDRIANPTQPNQLIHITSKIITRSST